eukprot:525153-Rhodomonas_salina.4
MRCAGRSSAPRSATAQSRRPSRAQSRSRLRTPLLAATRPSSGVTDVRAPDIAPQMRKWRRIGALCYQDDGEMLASSFAPESIEGDVSAWAWG